MKKKQLMFRYFTTGIFFLFTVFNSTGQSVIEKDTLAKYTFDELSDKFYAAKPDSLKAVLYAKYYIKKAKQEKDTLQIADGNYYLSDVTKDSIYFVNYWNDIIKKTKNKKNKLYPAISYLQLGDYYFQKNENVKALKKYLFGEKYTNKNDSLKYIFKHRIGIMKSKSGKIIDAIILYKESYNFYNNNNSKTNLNYFSVMGDLTTSFLKLKEYDSALFYNNKSYQLNLKIKNSPFLGYNIYKQGMINFKQNNYHIAIDRLNKAFPYLIDDENFSFISNTYNFLGQSYNKINNKKEAMKYFFKLDSLFLKTGNYYNSQKPAYKFLISHYKKEKNNIKQLEYINKYIKIDSVLNTRSKSISKNLTENYDIPNLLAEKKAIENKLKSDLSTTKKWAIAIGILAFLISLILIHQTRKRKLYKNRFQELINTPFQEVVKKEEITAKKEQSIPNEVVESILNHLIEFEKNHHYILHETTLSSLAKTFETNSKYLSQLINQHKEQSFNSYINQLRINYTVEKLKTDLTFRKYSIKAIAHEVGFNTTESFSKAFYKNTGIRPSFFIKELKN
jgi:YesN/AraC family two-component response regulator